MQINDTIVTTQNFDFEAALQESVYIQRGILTFKDYFKAQLWSHKFNLNMNYYNEAIS